MILMTVAFWPRIGSTVVGTSIEKTPASSSALPRRSGLRPKTIRGPLHVQCTGHGDPNLLHQIIQEVLDWPQIESTAPFVGYQDTVSIRLRETACTDNASAFISGREFARVLLEAPTIYHALLLVCAHWAIVRGCAEPHYLTFYGLIAAGDETEKYPTISPMCATDSTGWAERASHRTGKRLHRHRTVQLS